MWLGAVVDIPRHVYTKLGNLGPKLHFLRLPRTFRSEKDLMEQTKTGRFKSDLARVEAALYDYLKWFEACPVMNEKNGIAIMDWNREKDDNKAVQYIARLAILLSHLRAAVDTWDTHGSQGSDYAYTLPRIEEPDRANQQLYNLARGHALSQGRNYIAIDDIPLVIKVVLSTAPLERAVVFEYLISRPDGRLATGDLVTHMHMSPPTARRTMTELEATGLVDGDRDGPWDNSPKEIVLKQEFFWCTKRRFRQLRQNYSLARSHRNQAPSDKKSSDRGDNVGKSSRKQKEKTPPHPHILFFWETFNLLEDKKEVGEPSGGTVSEAGLKQALISSGNFNAGDATQTIKELIDTGEIQRLGFDCLKRIEENTETKR
jgi:DNA-binding transcriptional ArsR family regulator